MNFLPECQKMWRYVHSFRHDTGIRQTDRRTDLQQW